MKSLLVPSQSLPHLSSPEGGAAPALNRAGSTATARLILRFIGALVLVLICLWNLASGVLQLTFSTSLADFGSFLASGQAANTGLNPYGIYPPLTFRVQLPGGEQLWNPNLNPPISTQLFQLFDYGDPHAALQVWRGISAGFYVAAMLLCISRAPVQYRVTIALWALALPAVWDTLLLGQIYLPLVFAAVLAWALLERGNGMAAGLLIGIIAAVKPNFLVWPMLLLLSGRLRPALTAFAIMAILSAIPLATHGLDIYKQWFALLLTDQERYSFLTNASVTGLAARAGVPMIGSLLSVALLAVLAIWAFLRRPPAHAVSAVALVASILASPIGWYHYGLLLLPVVTALWHRVGMRAVAFLFLAPLFLTLNQFDKPAWHQLTIGSIYGWTTVLCLVFLALEFWRVRQPQEQQSINTRHMSPEANGSRT